MTAEIIESTSRTAEEVIRRIGGGVPALADRITGRIFAEIPIYASGAIATREAVLQSVVSNVEDAFDRLSGQKFDLAAAVKTGRVRAQQGLPLADLLTSFRMGYDETWGAIIRAARAAPAIPADDIVDLSHNWFHLHNLVGDTLIHAYREEAQHLLLTRERERAALVNVLLSTDVGLATVVEVADKLRLPVEGVFVVVAAATGLGKDPIPRVDSNLAAIDVGSVWHLTQDALVGVLSLEKATRMGPVLEVLGRHASGPVGVSPVFAPLRRAAWALGLAQLVLRRHSGAAAVEQFKDNPMNVLVASAPDAAQETSRTILGGLLRLPAERRDLLLETFTAWIESGGSAQATGELLTCHPNTVRHRLRRIELATGKHLTHPGEIAELVAACHAWTQLPPQSWE
ncbi:helix-turn-helix domain-containing protein [Glycomyces scopariae]|uniref:PucR C-terminal helix-turn-helix domain-containing protein n=1 Tax=Glycomyces sambucus TaxID=380244 RepID=A0A1G9FT06_9ACTN|nr:helix-turn-helix domain-containing protein [Glycomyces sambucus]SDK91556.1 PucR C-terminal helix-turn-helix domain-containing protein [Glycomyces sambucus]